MLSHFKVTTVTSLVRLIKIQLCKSALMIWPSIPPAECQVTDVLPINSYTATVQEAALKKVSVKGVTSKRGTGEPTMRKFSRYLDGAEQISGIKSGELQTKQFSGCSFL